MRRAGLFVISVCLVAFCVAGCGNSRPQLDINSYADQEDGTVKVEYTLTMFEPEKVSIVANYSSDQGMHWLPATAGSTGDGTTNLVTSRDGTEHTYSWNYSVDLGAGFHKGVILRLTPYADIGRGKEDSTGALDIGSPLVYCANYGTTTVSVVDTQKNTVLSPISVGTAPCSIIALPNNLAVYVTNKSDGTVSVIDTATNSRVKNIPVGIAPKGLVASPDSAKVYVVNSGEDTEPGTVSVIEVSSNSLDHTITEGIGNTPMGIAITPDGSMLFITNSMDDTVTVIDAETEDTVATVAVGLEPRGIACSPNGRYTYVCNYGEDTISVINNYRLEVNPQTIAVGSEPEAVAASPDGTRTYVANSGDDNVSVIDANTLTVTNTVEVDSEPRGITISSDGAILFVTNFAAGKISRIDAASLTVVASITVGANPLGVTILSK
jgi:YVTN family beta-propeller protein